MDEIEDIEDIEYIEFLQSLERVPVRLVYNRSKNDLDVLDKEEFRKRYRFNKETIQEITTLLTAQLSAASSRNRALSPSDKVLAAVRFFCFGIKQKRLGDMENMSQASASRAVHEVAEALASLSVDYIKVPDTEEERRHISQEFYHKFGFPGVIGALDCTLVKIISPGGSQAEKFRSQAGFFALNVQILSDSEFLIRNFVERFPGGTDDSTIFDNSDLKLYLETQVPSSYHVLGDNRYPLRPYLLTPFLCPANESEIRYNAAHEKARSVVKMQCSLWKKRFSCFNEPLRCSTKNAQLVIIATAVLHNIAIKLGDNYEEDLINEDDGKNVYYEWNAAGTAKRNAIVRNYFSD